MSKIPAIDAIIEDFSYLSDWEDKYSYLIDLSKKLPDMDEALKTDSHIVQGCMSRVWMVPIRTENGRFSFIADSDAIIVRGLIAILYSIFHGVKHDAIQGVDVGAIFKTLELDQNISPNRRNGFYAMVEKIKHIC